MNLPLPVLTTGDLPTLRKLAHITRKLADDGAPDVTDDPLGRHFIESFMQYSAKFHERLVRELESFERRERASKN